VRQQVGAPGRVLWATIVGPDRKKPVRVVDQCQRLSAGKPDFAPVVVTSPIMSIPAELRRPCVRGITTLSIRGATWSRKRYPAGLIRARSISASLSRSRRPRIGLSRRRVTLSTVPNARYARVINEGYQTITSGSWTWIAQPGNVVGTRSVRQPPVAHRTEEEGMS